MMRLLHWLLGPLMRRVEEAMIRRLLKQRDFERAQIDTYRQNAKMRMGEFLPPHDDEIINAAIAALRLGHSLDAYHNVKASTTVIVLAGDPLYGVGLRETLSAAAFMALVVRANKAGVDHAIKTFYLPPP